MTLDDDITREYVTQISEQVVAALAPEETELFEEMIENYFDNPEPPPSPVSGTDETLAFGGVSALVPLTPAAAAAVTAVLSYILTEIVGEAAKDGLADGIKERISKAVSKDPESKSAQFTREQLQTIKMLAQEQGVIFHLSDKRANRLATAIVGAIATK